MIVKNVSENVEVDIIRFLVRKDPQVADFIDKIFIN